jgi:transposase-like protein
MPIRSQRGRMTRLVARWRGSGESQAGFARRHGVAPWTFWYWCRKVSREDRQPSDASPPPFVPVRLTPEAEAGVVEVLLPAGERVRVGAGASAEVVRAVVTALRSAC